MTMEEGKVAFYTSGQDNNYFGWEDATEDTARELADKFEQRFPAIISNSFGNDYEYVGWYVEMLGMAELGALPEAYFDYHTSDNWAGLGERKLSPPPNYKNSS